MSDMNLPPIIEEEIQEVTPTENVEPVKRRGRPPGSKNKVQESPDSPKPVNIDANQEKRRGRPPGSGTKKVVDKSALSKQLLFAHAVAAKITGIDDIAIDAGEAEILSSSIATLMQEYDIALSGKTAAMLGMIGSLAIVYGPRIVLINEKIKQTKARKQAEKLMQVAANGQPA